uniref:Helentron 4 helitron-like transposon replicase/helicase/endonuclease n=1 Tax=Nothobranchius furzeri TaxID=105023 RepID=A0A1A8B2B9_NOTFU
MEDVTVSGRITRHRSDARVTANAEKQTGETLEEPNTLQNQVKYSCRCQYGFREKKTTALTIMEATDEIINTLDKGKYAIGVFIDFRKAFDTINHPVLINKLQQYGIRGMALDWITNYLSKRQQFVKMVDVTSESMGIACGVPQGSVLGPALFNIYINDIFQVCKTLKMILIADDTNLFYAGNDLNEIINIINKELS